MADYCFPNALEAIEALQCVVDFAGKAPKALYYLGNLWYDKRRYPTAIAAWERSSREDETFPTVWRNLSLAYFNKMNRPDEAVALLEKAFRLDHTDARVLMELDQLYKRLNRPHIERLCFLEQHIDIVMTRDDLYLEYVTLLNQTGQYREAIRRIDQRKFHPLAVCAVHFVSGIVDHHDYPAGDLLSDCAEESPQPGSSRIKKRKKTKSQKNRG